MTSRLPVQRVWIAARDFSRIVQLAEEFETSAVALLWEASLSRGSTPLLNSPSAVLERLLPTEPPFLRDESIEPGLLEPRDLIATDQDDPEDQALMEELDQQASAADARLAEFEARERAISEAVLAVRRQRRDRKRWKHFARIKDLRRI